MTPTKKLMLATLSAAALALTAGSASARFDGTWKVKDSVGKEFEIVVGKDGTASGEHAGKPMKGHWIEAADAVTITWENGWTTKIAKDGTGYKKTAFEGENKKGADSAAVKVK